MKNDNTFKYKKRDGAVIRLSGEITEIEKRLLARIVYIEKQLQINGEVNPYWGIRHKERKKG